MNNQQDNHVAESVKNASISAVQRIINNRLADSENTNEASTSQVDMMSGVGTESIAAYDQMETYQSFKDHLLQYGLDNGFYDSLDSDGASEFGDQINILNNNLMSINKGDESAVNYKGLYQTIISSEDPSMAMAGLTGLSGAMSTICNKSDVRLESVVTALTTPSVLKNIQTENTVRTYEKDADDVSNTTEQSEMLDSQNVSGESEHDSNDASLSTYEKAKEKFLNEKVVPYYESPSSDQVVEMGTKLDALKENLDGLAGHDTKNNSSWDEYFEELGNLNPGSVGNRVDKDCVSTAVDMNAKNVGSTMQSALKNGVEGVEKTIGDMAKGIDEKTNGALSNVIQSGQNAFSNAGQTIGELANNISSPVQNVFNGAIQSGQNIVNQFNNTISDMSKSSETNTVSYDEQDDNDQSILESKFANSKYC